MVEILIMPKLGFNMSVGKLVKWYKGEGDLVTKGEPVFAIETDKTSIDIEATGDGIFRKKFVEEGDSVEVTLPIAIIARTNENIDVVISECLAKLGKKSAIVSKEEKEEELEEISVITQKADLTVADGKVKITPRARRIAVEKGIDIKALNITGTGYKGGICELDLLTNLENNKMKFSPLAKKLAELEYVDIKEVQGSGINGKVVRKDVEDFINKTTMQVKSPVDCDVIVMNNKEILEIVEYSGVRKIIGERLSQSKFTSPHLYFTQKVNLEKLLNLRKEINTLQDKKTSVTDYIAKATIKALQKYPDMNSTLEGQKIIKYKTVNLGIAVASPTGLIVPVLKDAEKMDVVEISNVSGLLFDKARIGKLIPDEYTGGTFTISNLGMFGIENFTAIINPPESGILAISSTKDEVMVEIDEIGNKQVVIKPIMNITLSVDHRIIDGLLAAQFIGEIKNLLENPLSLLLK
jgi:pyruvate dehydrogenase E2 component (dihydrolipoamide acetyltransferase)